MQMQTSPSNTTPIHVSGGSLRHDDGSPISRLFVPCAPARHVRPGATIALDGTAVELIYEVVSGTVRCCTIAEDGSRHIFRFARAGDFLGLIDPDTWHYTVEAVDHVIVRSVPRARFDALFCTDVDLQRTVRQIIADEFALRERQLMRLAYMPAPERLRCFLEDFASTRKGTGFIALPLTRRDIGEHLGLTLETVSRAFSALRRDGIIEMNGPDRFRMRHHDLPLAA